MNSKGLFTQIGMILVSVAIIFTYIKPQLALISDAQEKTATYAEQRIKVTSVNQQLASLTGRMNALTKENKNRIATYLPDAVDSVSLMRDLQLIAEEAGVTLLNVQSAEDVARTKRDDRNATVEQRMDDVTFPEQKIFNLAVRGTYQQQRTLLDLLAQNDYPFEVQEYEITNDEFGGVLTADITLASYQFKPDPSTESN